MAASPTRSADDGQVRLCSFEVGDECYVVDIHRIQEVGRPLPITPVRRAMPMIEGVIDLRGQIIPIVDLRKAMGFPPAEGSRATKHMIVSIGGKVVGFVVDGMGRVLNVPRSAIQPAPALLEGDGGRIFPGVINHEGKLYLLLNLIALLEVDQAKAVGQIAAMRVAVVEGQQ